MLKEPGVFNHHRRYLRGAIGRLWGCRDPGSDIALHVYGLGIGIDFSLPSERVIRTLKQVIGWRSKPLAIRYDICRHSLTYSSANQSLSASKLEKLELRDLELGAFAVDHRTVLASVKLKGVALWERQWHECAPS